MTPPIGRIGLILGNLPRLLVPTTPVNPFFAAEPLQAAALRLLIGLSSPEGVRYRYCRAGARQANFPILGGSSTSVNPSDELSGTQS